MKIRTNFSLTMKIEEDFVIVNCKLKSLRISTKYKKECLQLAFENTDDKEVEEITETYTCTTVSIE